MYKTSQKSNKMNEIEKLYAIECIKHRKNKMINEIEKLHENEWKKFGIMKI